MKKRLQAASQDLTDYDLFLFRKFCGDELRNYLAPMRDFWAHAASYSERGAGEHPLLDSRFAGEAGYRVEKRKMRAYGVRGVAAYPFVYTRALKVLPTDGSKRFIMRKAMAEPIRIEEFYCVLDSDKRVAFLTEEAYAATCSNRSICACVPLGREEAYAILSGKMLERTRKKIIRIFDMEDGEWVDSVPL